MTGASVLLTGANGYLGQLIAKGILEGSDQSLILWVHARNQAESERKQAQLLERFPNERHRISVAWGDLEDETPFASIKPEQVGEVIHGAAVIRFNVEPDLADRVNLNGTRKILHFAQRCPKLKLFTQLSTIYASGLVAGVIEEAPIREPILFANHYERSKCAAERLLVTEFDELPWKIARLATIIADNDDGRVSQFNVFHNTMRLLYHGLISLVPGLPQTPLYFVTGELAANGVNSIRINGGMKEVFNICHRIDNTITLRELIDVCFATFSEFDEFSRKNVLKPLLTDMDSFELLAEGLTGLSGKIVSEAVSSIRPFAKQLFISKDFQIGNFISAHKSYQATDPVEQVQRTVRYLVGSKWGRQK